MTVIASGKSADEWLKVLSDRVLWSGQSSLCIVLSQ